MQRLRAAFQVPKMLPILFVLKVPSSGETKYAEGTIGALEAI
jgi:hypothetical protein